MKIIPAFHHELFLFDISGPEIDLLRIALDDMFNSPKMKYGNYRGYEVVGFGRSTVSIPNHILKLPGIDFLLISVKDRIKELEPTKDLKNHEIIFGKIWANRNYKGSEVKVHHHPENPENVCIFYIDVPEENCADLVVVENGKQQTHLSEYNEDKKVYIKVKTGNLIVHKPDVFHAVSEHKSDYPRTCIVINYTINR